MRGLMIDVAQMLEPGVFAGKDFAYLLASGSSASSDLPGWVPAAALVAAAASLAGLLLARLGDRRDRRRTLYSEAYQAALAWEEVYYRVRRRDSDRPYELAGRVHEIQEQVNFYEGWIGSESSALCRAYCRLVLTIKAHTAEPIREAWAQQPSKPEDSFSVEPLRAPEIEVAKGRFISDLRDHLSINPLRRGALVRRYENPRWERIKQQIANKEE